ncbi:DUF1566 domain-containing protein [bacterium]|nr:DUF1566 domain-containing protein [bacterium]
MRLRVKSQSETCFLIVFAAVVLLPLTGFAKPKPIMTTDILQHLRKGEPWDRGVFASTKMVNFQQATNTSGGTDATSVSKITLSYFTSTDCTATNGTSVPTYTTPNGTSFTISVGTPFGMVAASAWNVGNSKVSPAVADMTLIQSIAVTLKSTDSNTPQASFTGISFACVPVTCSGGECTSGSGTQSFQLKTTTAIGDPADGGVIACKNGGLNNLVTPTADNSTGIGWGGSGTTTSATSTTDGATNTTTIVAALGSGSSYAAITCSTYSAAGGYTSGWFLPAGNNTTSTGQLSCLFINRVAIGGFSVNTYWSSTEASSANAWRQGFNFGNEFSSPKTSSFRVRCSRAFTP